jgi:parallel beta-helix repeat protein
VIGRGVSEVLIVLVLFSPIVVLSASPLQRTTYSPSTEIKSSPFSEVTYNSSVKIFSDADFILQNWPGNGTADSPYIISSLRFSHSEWTPVVIKNTRAHFILSDCVIAPLFEDPPSSSIAISIENVTNGIIENCSISDKSTSFALNKVNDSIIRNNVISYSNTPIIAEQLLNCEITNNSIFYSNRGIELRYTVNSNITKNTIVECSSGITLISESNDNTIAENRVGWCGGSYAQDYCTGNNWTSNSWSNWNGENPYMIEGLGFLIIDSSPSRFVDDFRGPTFEFRRYYAPILNYFVRSPFTFEVNVSDDSRVASAFVFIREYHQVDGENQWVWIEYELSHIPISGNPNRFTYTYNITGPFLARYIFWANDTLGNSRRSDFDAVQISQWQPEPKPNEMITFVLVIIGMSAIAYAIWRNYIRKS